MEDDEKIMKNRSLSHRKKSSRSKCKLTSKRNSSYTRKRKKRNVSKMVSQDSVDNVPCFPIPFADFFCGCGKDCGKEKNRIKKISSKRLSKISKKSKTASKVCEKNKSKEESKEKKVQISNSMMEPIDKVTKKHVNNLPALTEPIDLDRLNINGSMKHLLANVKVTSMFGCANVPKTMSQIKILLVNNPSLKCQLKHILGDNLKNESLKPIAELLQSENEDSTDESNDSYIRGLSISKSVLNAKKDSKVESLNSSDILSKKHHSSTEAENANEFSKNRTKSRNVRVPQTQKNDVCDSQVSLFSKLFSSVFRSAKPSPMKQKQSASVESNKMSKKSSKTKRTKDNNLDDGKTNDMRLKYDEWYNRSPEEVRERFRWEDYVRVTMYLNDIKENSFYKDPKTREMLNMWLRKFSKEINRHELNDDYHYEKPPDMAEGNVPDTQERYNSETKLKRLNSNDMLNAGDGDGNVVIRLNSLMKELVQRTENEEDKKRAGEGEYLHVQSYTEKPGCSKRPEPQGINAESIRKNSTVNDEVSLFQMMCASFVSKLSKHGSRESKSILGSRYTSEIPWQNKDFQVFCVPIIETEYSFDFTRDAETLTELSEDSRINCVDNISDNNKDRENGLSSASFEESRVSLDSLHPSTEMLCNTFEPEEGEIREMDKLSANKSSHQKRVSFEDETNTETGKEHLVSDHEENSFNETSYSQMNNAIERENEFLNINNGNLDNFETCDKNSGTASEPISSYSDLDDILQQVGQTMTDKLMKNSQESIDFFKKHKYELIQMLKYLVSLANQNPNVFQPGDFKLVLAESSKEKQCFGVQCKLSQECCRESRFSNISGTNISADLRNYTSIAKSFSETGAKNVDCGSDSTSRHVFKLASTSSDSGVHTKSSNSSHRRQCASLPDVLEGASPGLVENVLQGEKTDRDDEFIYAKDSSGSNLLTSCLSTSVSCQASQTPDIDDISQVSSLDSSENNVKIIECQSSTSFKLSVERPSTSDKSRSSENARCLDVQTKVGRSTIQKILRKMRVKEIKK